MIEFNAGYNTGEKFLEPWENRILDLVRDPRCRVFATFLRVYDSPTMRASWPHYRTRWGVG